jgi:hypothetical protein
MFSITDSEAAAIRTAFDRDGELSAAVELRRLFPGVTDNAKAWSLVRITAGCRPLPVVRCPVTRLRAGPGKQQGRPG